MKQSWEEFLTKLPEESLTESWRKLGRNFSRNPLRKPGNDRQRNAAEDRWMNRKKKMKEIHKIISGEVQAETPGGIIEGIQGGITDVIPEVILDPKWTYKEITEWIPKEINERISEEMFEETP